MRCKTVLVVVFGLVVGAFGMFLVMSSVTVDAGCTDDPCDSPPCCNGDVNGDAAIDISDAVYLLTYLFVGGDAPVAITDPGWPPPQLPATGQTLCYKSEYDNMIHPIDCDSEIYPGQDGFFQAGCPTEGRFTNNGDGTVTDTCTGLMWQLATLDLDGNGTINNNDTAEWQDSLYVCKNLILCNDGTWTRELNEVDAHGGIKYDDWRLPNVRELSSIVHYGSYDQAINPVFLSKSRKYWSSTSFVGSPGVAWVVFFFTGTIEREDKENLYYVRVVRG